MKTFLKSLADDESGDVRREAARALDRIYPQKKDAVSEEDARTIRKQLVASLAADEHYEVRRAAASALDWASALSRASRFSCASASCSRSSWARFLSSFAARAAVLL